MSYVLGFLLLLLVAGAFFYCFPFVRVVGSSMWPTYKDGQYLWSVRLYKKLGIKINDVCVLVDPDPSYEGKLLIKRCTYIEYEKGSPTYWFLGDNRDDSRDSREFGFIYRDNVVAKVLFAKERVE